MTPYEQDLLQKYLAHLNVVGDDGDYPDFEAWYQAVRYAQGPAAPVTLEDACELQFKDVLEAAWVFNRLHATGNQFEEADDRRSRHDQQNLAAGPLQARGQAQQEGP